MSLKEIINNAIIAVSKNVNPIEFKDILNPILKAFGNLDRDCILASDTITGLHWVDDALRITTSRPGMASSYYIDKEILESDDPVKTASFLPKEKELENTIRKLEYLQNQQKEYVSLKRNLEKELTELHGWKYNERIPYSVKQMTDEEFKLATQKAIDNGFPDLTPCCKREYRASNGGCVNCGDPCW